MPEDPSAKKKKPRRSRAGDVPRQDDAERPARQNDTPALDAGDAGDPGAPVEASDWDAVENPDDGFSLDDLGAAYAKAFAEHDPETFASVASEPLAGEAGASEGSDHDDPLEIPGPDAEDENRQVTPAGIVEAALFVGHPKNQSLSDIRLASLMRDVTPEEVSQIIDELNASYREQRQALRITRDDQGYRMTVAPEVESVRRSFYGKVREARLSQAAVEVLALVAYQPGATAQIVQDQRGHESGSILNQLVRRQLLEMRREVPADGAKPVPHYYPTERFLYLFGLESLDDLPQVEESTR